MPTLQLTPQDTTITMFVLAVIALISIVFALISLASTAKLKRRLKKWREIHATADLDTVYEKTLGRVEHLSQQLRDTEHEMDALAALVRGKISTAQVVRYNAFSDLGSDLSFSIALLDDDANGLVLSSIYGREESRSYAKPVLQGQSKYALADEEKQVLQEAMSRRGTNR